MAILLFHHFNYQDRSDHKESTSTVFSSKQNNEKFEMVAKLDSDMDFDHISKVSLEAEGVQSPKDQEE